MWETFLSWDWTGFLKAVLGASVGTSIVQGFLAWRRDRNEQLAQAGHLAQRLAVILEKYGRSCCEFIERNESAPNLPGEQFPAWHTTLPSVPQLLPDDLEGWRSLDRALGAKIHALPGHIEERQNSINSTAENWIEDLEEELSKRAAESGLEALNLAKALRRRYSIGAAAPLYDMAEGLTPHLSKEKSRSSRWLRFWPFVRT